MTAAADRDDAGAAPIWSAWQAPTREHLWSLPWRQWPELVVRTTQESTRDRITSIAGNLAFHGFLALLPVVIATVALLGIEGLSNSELHSLIHAVGVLLPNQMATIINDQLLRPASRQVNVLEVVFGLAVALWSSIEAMAALQVALDVAYEVPSDRGLIGRRVMALPLIAVTVVLGGVASALLVLGGPIGRLLPGEFRPLLTGVRYGGSFVLLVLLLSAYYNIGPARPKIVWEWVSPGAVVAAGGWILSSLAFSYYLDNFGHETRTYGALAGVAVTLLWLFLTGTIILAGAELNRELERLGGAHTSGTVAIPTPAAHANADPETAPAHGANGPADAPTPVERTPPPAGDGGSNETATPLRPEPTPDTLRGR